MVAFSQSARSMRSSEIRKLMKLAADPAIISFAGGMPNNQLFPVDAVDELWSSLPRSAKQAAFQYGPTPGYPPLIETIKHYLKARGLPLERNELLITTGAQQAINLLAKVFLDPEDVVITEYPSFIGALAAFQSYGARLVDCAMDEQGILPDALAAAIRSNQGPMLKMAYLNPVFQNPSGLIYSEQRKKEVIEILAKERLCLLEDDPYSELYFDEADRPLTLPIKAMADERFPVCYVGSLAKIFGPGMRLGYMLAPTGIVEKCELAKQSMDACSSTFAQVLAQAFLSGEKLGEYLGMLRPTYARRAGIMLDALAAHMPAEVRWTKPRGGFYVWVTLPQHINASRVFEAALAQGAAFVIGSAFDPQGERNNSLRLAFSHTPEEKIAQGVEIVCNAVRKML
jgi:DNA-binding transcriptional MocR family regulator